MRTEQLLNHSFLGFRSFRGWYHWIRTVINGMKMSNGLPINKRVWCLSHGFAPADMNLYGEKKLRENYHNYLSEKQYYKLHPINGQYSFWIDDKLTMKYIFSKYNEFLPKYYFQMEHNHILRLGDCDQEYEASVDGILKCLDEKGVLALKRMWGSFGNGFYKIEKDAEGYKITGKRTAKKDVEELLSKLEGYLVLEYVVNDQVIREIWPEATNTMRLLMANIDGKPEVMRSFIRFGNAKSNGVDNAHAGGIESIIDEQSGEVLFTQKLDSKSVPQRITEHPDSGKSFSISIPHWDYINKVVYDICVDFPQLRYMGFDIVVTDDGFKILEINSLSGLMAAQFRKPLLEDEKTRAIFEKFGLKL